MRIALLANNTRVDNGWGRSARDLALALRDCGVEVDLFVEEKGGLVDERPSMGGAQTHALFVFVSALYLIPRLRRYDIIHAFDGYPYAVIAALVSFILRKPFVVTLHGTYALDRFYFRGRIMTALYRWALKNAEFVISVSRYTLSAVREHAKVPRGTVIPNGVPLNWVNSAKLAAPRGARRPYIIGVGMIKPQKGYTVSIKAFAETRKTHPELSYVIVGSQRGRHFAEVSRLVNELGAADAVIFLQNLTDNDLMALYDNAELFVLTPVRMGQYVEGFGIVYREAGARGLAVIGSKDCGAEDAVKDGITGILCKQGDVAAVSAAMQRLLDDKELRMRMGIAGKETAGADTWNATAKRYQELYAGILK